MLRTLSLLALMTTLYCVPPVAAQKPAPQAAAPPPAAPGAAAPQAAAPAAAQPPSARPRRTRLSGEIARLFPRRAALYVEVPHLATFVDTVGEREPLRESANAFLGDTGSKSEPLSEREMGLLLDASAAAALVADGDVPLYALLSVTAPNVAVLRLGSDEAVAVLRDRVFARYADAAQSKTETLLGVEVTHLKSFSYAVDGRTVVCGAPEAVAAVLETSADDEAARVAEEPGFLSAAAKHAGAEPLLRAYVGGHAAAQSLSSLTGFDIPEESPAAKKQREAEQEAMRKLFGADAVRGLLLTVDSDGSGVRTRYDIEIDRTGAGLVSIVADPPPLGFRCAASLSRDVESLQILSLDGERVYDALDRFLGPLPAKGPEDQTFRAAVAEVEAMIGMSLRDELLPALGTEAAVATKLSVFVPADPAPLQEDAQPAAEDAPPPAPPPMASPFDVIFVEVRNPEVVRRALTSVVAKSFGPAAAAVEPKEYKGAELWSAPGFAVALGGDFLLAGEEATVRRCLDARESGETLATSDDYLSKSLGWSGDAIYASYQSPKYDLALAKLREGSLAAAREAAAADGATSPEEAEALEAAYESGLESNSLFGSFASAPVFRDATGIHWESAGEAALMRRAVSRLVEEMLVTTPRFRRQFDAQVEAMDLIQAVVAAQKTYREKKGRFGDVEELAAAGALEAPAAERIRREAGGYRVRVAHSGAGDDAVYQATATPVEYGRWGKMSYFVDETGVVRGADKQGAPAGVDDPSLSEPEPHFDGGHEHAEEGTIEGGPAVFVPGPETPDGAEP